MEAKTEPQANTNEVDAHSNSEVDNPVHFDVSIKSSVKYFEIKQKTPGELPRLNLGGYRSPSGGYMNVARYKCDIM